MKKLIAILLILSVTFALAVTAAHADEATSWVFRNGIEFNMDMDQVIEKENRPGYEIDNWDMRGPFEFSELEYENVTAEGMRADIHYLFIGNSLVAFRFDFADGTRYDDVKAMLAAYGEAVPFDAARILNGRFAVDDDGDLKDCREMIEANGLTIVLERDHDGDVEVTFLDMTAAYITAK